MSGAIRTDFILSAEIMVITLNELTADPIVTQALALALVGVAVTIGVYGLVALLVKMDDVGLAMAGAGGGLAGLGRGLVAAMPKLLKALALIGTAAMLWVGGGILIHGLAGFGWHWPEETIHHLADAIGGGAAVAWVVTALCSGIVGLAAGAIVVAVLQLKPGKAKHAQ